MILYLDLDGVFADFEGACKKLGLDYSSDPKLAWATLDTVPHLFRDLEPLPYALSFFDSIMGMSYSKVDIKILTALPMITNKLYSAAKDKREWVHHWLHPDLEVICTNGWREKKNYCQPWDILIDDKIENIEDWKSVGGVGILHFNKHWRQTLIKLGDVYAATR